MPTSKPLCVGELTTTFDAPYACGNAWIASTSPPSSTSTALFQAFIGSLFGIEAAQNCSPPRTTDAANNADTVYLRYYSPAACPLGYSTACDPSLGVSEFPAGLTMQICCPSGYSCPQRRSSNIGCVSDLPADQTAFYAAPLVLSLTESVRQGTSKVATTLAGAFGLKVVVYVLPSSVDIGSGSALTPGGHEESYNGYIFSLDQSSNLWIDGTSYSLSFPVTTPTTITSSVTTTGGFYAYDNITAIYAAGVTVAWQATDIAVLDLFQSAASAGSTSNIAGPTTTNLQAVNLVSPGLSKGSIAGIAVGVICFVLLLLLGIGMYVRRLRHALKTAKSTKSESENGKPELDGAEVNYQSLNSHEMDSPPAIFYELPTHERPVEVGSESLVRGSLGHVIDDESELVEGTQHRNP
ncbi:hypothetical protein BU16DRAFT_602657 [Lophium mytilinum]|uniref:Uncharacterized protein n=1 Tax=Lophium mytilinum TaxID=390894 RepID=A0A6A6R7Q3_9PEZI|nr:hypothetical protein BU16DRAFT_602657 [Lophium mytilinum]